MNDFFPLPHAWSGSRHPPRGLRPWAAGLAVAAVLLTGGCSRNKFPYAVEPRFSMNVAPAPAWMTKPKAPLAAGEKEILTRRGKPDFIRYWWKTDGRPVTSSDFAGRRDQFEELIKNVKKSWIYLKDEQGEEVVFLRDGASYSVRPLEETSKLLCQYGDPSNRVNPIMIDGQRHETWMWIEHGIQVELVEGRIFATKNFQGTGVGTYLLK